jgi:ubiquinone/menaquinone biosynthesis C-methylase UbiE
MPRSDSAAAFIPALGFRRLTPLYDPLIRWFMGEERFKRRLIDLADVRPGMRVLDLGCGTGPLAIMVKRRHPEAEIVGIDPDPDMLKRARTKAGGACVEITFDQGFASELPYLDGRFDRVLASMMTHHLAPDAKRQAFAEVLRVLRPGGQFHIVDFGPARSPTMHLMASIGRRLEESETTLPADCRDVG